ncbi:RhuM family protein [Psychrobacter sp. CAL346-MNA-CIBAN-0220]|uniref:RhuM family protein n=1 Tax=Psychrobacter sp. CAL346-MNA-CIBAN-0220 TaxID=3140457 RepID=UPI003319FD50
MSERESQVVVYQTLDGKTRLEVQFYEETVWLTENQIIELFSTKPEGDEPKKNKSKKVKPEDISKHLKSIYEDNELLEDETSRVFSLKNYEHFVGINENKKHYNLDVILAIGYRLQARIATRFLKWATKEMQAGRVEPSFHRVYKLYIVQLGLNYILPFMAVAIIYNTVVGDNGATIIVLSIGFLIGVSNIALETMRYNESNGYKRSKFKS